MRKVSLSRSVSILALAAGIMSVVSSGYTTIVFQSANSNWGNSNNWGGGLAPTSADIAEFPQNGDPGATNIGDYNSSSSLAKSVKKIIFGSNAPGYIIDFDSAQSIGSDEHGVAINNLSGNLQTFNLLNDTINGSVTTASNAVNETILNGIGNISFNNSSGGANIYATVQLSANQAAIVGSTTTFYGPILGGFDAGIQASSASITMSSPDNNANTYTGVSDIFSGGSIQSSISNISSTSGVRFLSGGGILTFTDESSTNYTKPIQLIDNGTISGGNGAVTLSGGITDHDGNGVSQEKALTIGAGTIILGSGTNNYTGGTNVAGGATVQGLSANFPSSGGIIFSGCGGILQFTDTGSAAYSQTINSGGNPIQIGLNGPGRLTLDGSIITNGNGAPTVVVDGGGTLYMSPSFSNGDGFNGGAFVRNGSTLELDSGASLGYTSGVFFDSGEGHLTFYSSENNDSFTANIQTRDTNTSTVTMAGSGTLTLSGTIDGSGGVKVNKGTLVLQGPAGNYNGPTTIANDAKLSLSSIDISSTNGAFTINGGNFDISNFRGDFLTRNNQLYYLKNFTTTSGSSLTIGIFDDQLSTVFSLASTNSVNLDNLTLNINAASGTYTDGMEYLLFENAADTVFSNALHAINLNNLAGFTAALEPINSGDAQVKFKLHKTSVAPPPPTGGARNSASVQTSQHAVATNISSFVIGGTMVVARANAQDGAGGSGGDFGQTPSSFTRNPLKAPDLSKDFLSVTQGAMMTESKENAKRWSPARTEKTGVWVQPFGMTLRQIADGTAPGYKTRTGGVLAGFDHKVRYDMILGAGLGYAQTKLNFDSNQGKMGIKDKFLTFFGTWFRGPWYLEASILMGLEKYQGSRNTGINNQFALNHHGGYQLTPKIGGGYTFDVKESKLRTYATFDYAYSTQYGYQETGAGTSNLYWNKSETSMLRSEIGANLTKLYEFNDYTWKPGLTLAVVNKKPIKKGKIISPSAGSFESTTVTTTDISPGVESTWQFNDGYSLSASWTGEFGSQYNLQEASVKFTKKF